MRNRKRVAAVAAAAVLAASAAAAFGIKAPEKGVGAEHQRITRAAITDLEPATLAALAGRDDEPGAVGELDEMTAGPDAHCDDGDFYGENYPRSQAEAEAALTACRTLITAELEGAVGLAKDLVAPSADGTALDCDFKLAKGSTKCEVLSHLGRAFHASQDFYAHTNWVDRPADGAESVDNPPGLGKTGRAPWLDPRAQAPFPQGLISGSASSSWIGSERVTRETLSKDRGPIGKGGTAGYGFTLRGVINNNFKNAVAAAIDDTRDKWAYFKERVRAVYGADGEVILCALSRDTFDAAACAKVASSANACTRRRALLAGAPTNASTALDITEDERKDVEPLVSRLQRFCQLEEAGLTRDAVLGGGNAADGRAYARTLAIELLATWNACPVEARNWLTIAEPAHKQALRLREPGDKTSSRRDLLGAAYGDCILGARLQELGK